MTGFGLGFWLSRSCRQFSVRQVEHAFWIVVACLIAALVTVYCLL